MRLNKFISTYFQISRRQAEVCIKSCFVKLDDKIITNPAHTVDINSKITLNGSPHCNYDNKARLWGYYKDKGVIVTNFDSKNRTTLFSLLPNSLPRVITIGRLDLNSEGLILLTNSGLLARNLELPKNKFIRKYKVRAFGKIKNSELIGLNKNFIINKINYGPVDIKLITESTNNWFEVTLVEGKNREVRKIFNYFKLQVNRLIRIQYGEFKLENLDIKKNEVKELSLKGLEKFLPPS